MTLRLNGSTSGYVEIDAPAVAGSGLLTLPTGSGTVATQAFVAAADLAAGGLVHINTTTFSAVSSVSVNNVFTASHVAYEINFRVDDFITSQQLRYRYRVAGSDNSANNYTNKGDGGGASTVNVNLDNQNIGQLTNNEGPGFYTFRIDSPALAVPTMGISSGMNDNSARSILMGHLHTASTAFDGITFIASTGTFTGTIRVYGYKTS